MRYDDSDGRNLRNPPAVRRPPSGDTRSPPRMRCCRGNRVICFGCSWRRRGCRGCPLALQMMTAPFPWHVRESGCWCPLPRRGGVCVVAHNPEQCWEMHERESVPFYEFVFYLHPTLNTFLFAETKDAPLPEWLRWRKDGELSSTYCSTYSLYQRPWPLPCRRSTPLRHLPNSLSSRWVRYLLPCLFCRGHCASGGGGVTGCYGGNGGWGWGGGSAPDTETKWRVTKKVSRCLAIPENVWTTCRLPHISALAMDSGRKEEHIAPPVVPESS